MSPQRAATEALEQMRGYPADPNLAIPVGRSERERHYVQAVERRVAWLRAHPQPGWQAMEQAALRWMLARIAEAERREGLAPLRDRREVEARADEVSRMMFDAGEDDPSWPSLDVERETLAWVLGDDTTDEGEVNDP